MNKWVTIAVAFLIVIPSVADDIKYDQKSADEAAIFRDIEVKTRVCLSDSERIVIRQGLRDRDAIIKFAMRSCSFPLSKFLSAGYGTKQVSAEVAVTYIKTLAQAELKEITSIADDQSLGASSLESVISPDEANQKGFEAFNKKEYLEAMSWYRKAAQNGLAKAQHNIGVLYGNGLGVPKDDSEAMRWYQKAADQGYAPAQYNLGVHYESGAGVPKSIKKARYWYKLAADQGDEDAKKALIDLADNHGAPH